jgi:hypothetical protein
MASTIAEKQHRKAKTEMSALHRRLAAKMAKA